MLNNEIQPSRAVLEERRAMAEKAIVYNKSRLLKTNISRSNAVQLGIEDVVLDLFLSMSEAALNGSYHAQLLEYHRILGVVATGRLAEIKARVDKKASGYSMSSEAVLVGLGHKYAQIESMMPDEYNGRDFYLQTPWDDPIVKFNYRWSENISVENGRDN